MRRALLFLVLSAMLFGKNAKELEGDILFSIAKTFVKKDIIYLFCENKSCENLKAKKGKIIFVSNARDADIVFSKNASEYKSLCGRTWLFSLSYKDYKKARCSIGVFFWQKGRPNIIFNQKLIEKFNVNLPPSYHQFVE